MSSFYNRIGSMLGCAHPRASDDHDAAPPSPGTPDAMDSRAPPSPTVAPCAVFPPPPPRSPKAAADLATGLRYGVEVEHQGLSQKQVAKAVRAHVKGATYNHQLTRVSAADGRLWHLDLDGGGVELVTPILQGREDLELVQRIVATLEKSGGQTDARAGLHVHIDAARFSPEKMQTLVTLMARNEHWLYPVWGVHESRRSQWCQQMDVALVRELLHDKSGTVSERLHGLTGGSRYYGLNLQNFLTAGAKNTVEFRYLNGTLDPVAIGCAVGFYMALAERALASTGDATAVDVSRSTLPKLLQELDLDVAHPVAAHLYNLLRERIRDGWRPAHHGPMPDLDAFMRDGAAVDTLCLALNAADGPVEVAGTVSLMTRQSRAWRERLDLSAKALGAGIFEAIGRRPDHRLAVRWVAVYGATAQNMAPFIAQLGGNAMPAQMVISALDVIARNLHRAAHLEQACRVTVMVESGSSCVRYLSRLKELLVLEDAVLRDLNDALASLPASAVDAIGHRLAEATQRGEDIIGISKRLLYDAGTLQRNPHGAFNQVLFDLMRDSVRGGPFDRSDMLT